MQAGLYNKQKRGDCRRGAAIGFAVRGPAEAIAGLQMANNDRSYKFVKETCQAAVVTVAVGVTV